VTLAVPHEIYPILAVKLNEPVVVPYAWAEEIFPRAERADALLIGCGLGQSARSRELVDGLLKNAPCPIVLDADGINLLNGHIHLLRETARPCILTPHAGEFARLTGMAQPTGEDARRFAMENNCVLLLKGHRSWIALPDGRLYRNTTGNAGMAKGGSGDVLAGVILSLLGQGADAAQAALAGAFVHGAAGDQCARRLGQYGSTPGDLLDALPLVLKEYGSEEW
jgi:NAD(P)H-hydrate epimerase